MKHRIFVLIVALASPVALHDLWHAASYLNGWISPFPFSIFDVLFANPEQGGFLAAHAIVVAMTWALIGFLGWLIRGLIH